MKRFISLLIIYVIFQDGSNTIKATYEGMDQSIVGNLIQEKLNQHPGMTSQIVDEKTFRATPDPVRVVPPDPVKVQAILDAKDSTKSPQARIDALIKAIDLK